MLSSLIAMREELKQLKGQMSRSPYRCQSIMTLVSIFMNDKSQKVEIACTLSTARVICGNISRSRDQKSSLLNLTKLNRHEINNNNNNNNTIAIQRFNAVLLHDGFPSEDHPD